MSLFLYMIKFIIFMRIWSCLTITLAQAARERLDKLKQQASTIQAPAKASSDTPQTPPTRAEVASPSVGLDRRVRTKSKEPANAKDQGLGFQQVLFQEKFNDNKHVDACTIEAFQPGLLQRVSTASYDCLRTSRTSTLHHLNLHLKLQRCPSYVYLAIIFGK